MTKLINMKLVQKHEINDLLKARYLCHKNISSFQNIFCDGVIKVANYLKCNPKKDQERISLLVMYAFESQLIGSYHENEAEFNSSIFKFSRCIEKLCPMYHLKIHLICVKMINSTSSAESNLVNSIRILLNPLKEYLLIDTMDNLQLHYEYNFKELIRNNTQTRYGEIELPSIDDTRATLLIELTGTTLSASDLLRTIHLEHDQIQFTLLCTLPRSGLYPICILGNPLLVTARNSQSISPRSDTLSLLTFRLTRFHGLFSLEEKDNAVLFHCLTKHLAESNTLFILQSLKKPTTANTLPFERQFWALVPPGMSEPHHPFEYQIHNMVLVQLSDRDSFLVCSNAAMQISTKPPGENSDLHLADETERENEMKEFVETSTRLLESVAIYNPLAFVSRKYQIPSGQPEIFPTYQPSTKKIKEARPAERNTPKSAQLPVASTPSKRPPIPSSTAKFHSKRVKTKSDWVSEFNISSLS
jgi:hypothetical protein